jgi:hypothetical protein
MEMCEICGLMLRSERLVPFYMLPVALFMYWVGEHSPKMKSENIDRPIC